MLYLFLWMMLFPIVAMACTVGYQGVQMDAGKVNLGYSLVYVLGILIFGALAYVRL